MNMQCRVWTLVFVVGFLGACAPEPGVPFIDPKSGPRVEKPPTIQCDCSIPGNCDPKAPVRCGNLKG